MNTRAAAAVAAAAAAACELNEEPRLPTYIATRTISTPTSCANSSGSKPPYRMDPACNSWQHPLRVLSPSPRWDCLTARWHGGVHLQQARHAQLVESEMAQKCDQEMLAAVWRPGYVWHSSAGLWPIRCGIAALSSARCRRVPAGAAAAAARAVVAAAVHAARPLVGLGWSIPRAAAA